MSKTAKRFTNFSDENFIGVYDKVEYKLKAGETMMFPSYLAEHFAKHLIDREINRLNRSTNTPTLRAEMMLKCLGEVEVEEENDEKVAVAILNKKIKAKAGLETPKVLEEEFEGLNEDKVEKSKIKTSKK